jgi:hypothetical protein
LDYNYTVKGSNLKPVERISKSDQKKALRTVLNTLDAETLAIPERILDLFPPRAFGYSRSRESFKSKTGVSFVALGATATASDMSLGLLLNSERANRLIQQKSLENSNLGLEEVLQELVKNTIDQQHNSAYLTEVQNTINFNVLKHLMNLSANPGSIPQVKALANKTLQGLKDRFNKSDSAVALEMSYRIDQFMDGPEKFKVIPSPKIPDGSPIGSFQCLNR